MIITHSRSDRGFHVRRIKHTRNLQCLHSVSLPALRLRRLSCDEIRERSSGQSSKSLLCILLGARQLTEHQAVNHIPGYRPPFSPLDFPGVVIPTTWWNTGIDVHFERRHDSAFSVFHKLKLGLCSSWVAHSVQGTRMHLIRTLYQRTSTDMDEQPRRCEVHRKWRVERGLSEASVVDESARVCAPLRLLYLPQLNSPAPQRLWGPNLAASNGEQWRKHRRVMGPAFNAKLCVHFSHECQILNPAFTSGITSCGKRL